MRPYQRKLIGAQGGTAVLSQYRLRAKRREDHAPPVLTLPFTQTYAQGAVFSGGQGKAVIAAAGIVLGGEGNADLARDWFKKAESKDIDYVFPFRLETVAALDKAIEYLPQSHNTWYYLGNLYYHKQPEKALEAWEKAAQAKPDFAMALRNLGWYWRFKNENKDKDFSDYAKAIDYYNQAIASDTEGNALFLAECDEIMELIKAPLIDRYNLFNGKEALYEKRYDSETKAIKQRILQGEYAPVLEKLQTRF